MVRSGPGLRSWQNREKVHVDLHFPSAEGSLYPAVGAGGDINGVGAQKPSASPGLHFSPWTRSASVLGCGVVALSPPLLGACSTGRPGAPAAPATIRLGSCTDNFPGEEEVSLQEAARQPNPLPWSGQQSLLGEMPGTASPDLCFRHLTLNLKLWIE